MGMEMDGQERGRQTRPPSQSEELAAPPPSSPAPSSSVWLSMEDVLNAIGTHRKQWIIVFTSAIVYGHFGVQAMTPTIITKWLWETWPDLEERVPYFNTVFAMGSICRLLGSMFLLPMLDLWGRYPYLLIFTILSFVFASLSGAAPNFPTYAVLRSLGGLCASVLPSASTIYAVEMVQVKRRALPSMVNQFIATIYVSYASAIKIALRDKDGSIAWRYAQTLIQLPTIISIAFYIILPLETPRFLLSNKKNKPAAFRTFVKLFRRKDEQGLRQALKLDERLVTINGPGQNTNAPLHELIKLKGFEQEDTAAVGGIAVSAGQEPNGGGQTAVQRVPWWKAYGRAVVKPYKQAGQLFSNSDYRQSSIAILSAWIFQSLSHWGMFTYMTVFFSSLEVNADLTTIGCFLFQIPIQGIVLLIMQQKTWGGRIPAIGYTAAACSTASIVLCIMMVSGVKNKVVLTLFCILSCILSGPIWGPLYSYSAERYPTTFRGSAMALFSSSNALSTVLTSFVGSIVISKAATRLWIYPLVWGVLRLGVCASCFFMDREMNLTALEDKVGQATQEQRENKSKETTQP